MQNNPQDNATSGDSFRESVNVAYFASLTLATCITPFIRTRFGTHANGFNAVFALILIFFVAAESRDPAMFEFLVAWIIFLVFQRLITLQTVLNRRHEHSNYRGYPWAAMLLPFVRTERAAKAIEPVLCFGAGMLLGPLSPTLGLFIMATGVGLFILRLMEVEAVKAQLRQLRDAEIEHQYLAERYREIRNR